VPADALRHDPRLAGRVQVLVSCEGWKGFVPLWTQNVSSGGVFCSCHPKACPPVGAQVAVRVGSESLLGRVAHVRSALIAQAARAETGFGIGFSERHPFWWTLTGLSGSFPAAPEKAVSESQRRSAENLYQSGMRHLRAKNFALAAKKFDEAFQVTEELRFLAMRVVCGGYQYLATGLFDKAKEAFVRALEIAPACREASTGLEELARNTPPP
jgi:hypothetical protein